MMQPIIDIFDFDGTLYRGDSLFTFARFALGRRALTKALLRSIDAIIRWKLGCISNSEAKEVLFRNLYASKRAADIEAKAQAFVPFINARLRHEVYDAFIDSLRSPRLTIIISANFDLWLAPWAESIRMSISDNHSATGGNQFSFHLISTRAEINESGIITGRFATPNCHGEEKLRRLKEFLKTRAEQFPDVESNLYSNAEISVWGDSDGDIPLFKIATHPHRIR